MSQTTVLQPQKNLVNNQEKFPMSSTFPMNISPVMLPLTGASSLESLALGQSNNQVIVLKNLTTASSSSSSLIRPIPVVLPVPPSSKMADLNLNQTTSTDPLPPLSLKLCPTPSSSSSSEQQQQQQQSQTRHASAFQAMPSSFDNSSGDSIISVA